MPRIFLTALLTIVPAFGTVSDSITVRLAALDRFSPGQPMRIAATFEGTAHAAKDVYFSINASSEWRMVAGPLTWAGRVPAGETVTLEYVAIPVTGDVSPLSARVIEVGQPEWTTALQPKPESFRPVRRAFVADTAFARRETTVTRTVRGRVMFLRRGILTPLRDATVELLDNDTVIDDQCGVTSTDTAGNFEVTGTCSDPFGNAPDFFLRVSLESNALLLRNRTNIGGPYQFDLPMPSSQGQTLTVGSGRDEEFALTMFNSVNLASSFIRNNSTVSSIQKATVEWPAETLTSRYNQASKVIHIARDFNNFADQLGFTGEDIADFAVIHEYGHHVQDHLAELTLAATGTHGLYTVADNLELAFSEGWANFIAATVLRGTGNTLMATESMSFESHSDTSDAGAAITSGYDRIEGFIAAILVDLTDSTNDDQHTDQPENSGPGRRDAVTIPFGDVMDVLRFYNPPGNANNPRDIHQLWDGFKARLPNRINQVSEVYREHHIVKPQPDLVVDSVSVASGNPVRGQFFQARRVIRNAGNETAVSASIARYKLAGASGDIDLLFNGFGIDVLGPNLAPGSSNTGVFDVMIPTSAPAGLYKLVACADTFDNVPESADGPVNNCRSGDFIRLQ